MFADIGWTVVKFQQPFPTLVSVFIKLCYCLSVTLVHAQNKQAVMSLCCKCAKGQVKVWNVAEFEAETCFTISVSTNWRHSQKSPFMCLSTTTYSNNTNSWLKGKRLHKQILSTLMTNHIPCVHSTQSLNVFKNLIKVTFTHTWHRLLHRKHCSCCRTNSSAFASQHTTHRNLGTQK